MEGIDVVVHMGGRGTEAEWEVIHEKNIVGTYNVFEAARRQKVRRVIYASSHHAVGFYRRSNTLDLSVAPRPDGPYGVSKVFGEALGRMYADKHGMSVVSLRIGAFRQKPEDIRHLSVWLSPRDCLQLIIKCIEAPDLHYAVIYGISNNTRSIWDNSGAALIGYKPGRRRRSLPRGGAPEGDARGRHRDRVSRRPFLPDGFRRRSLSHRLELRKFRRREVAERHDLQAFP